MRNRRFALRPLAALVIFLAGTRLLPAKEEASKFLAAMHAHGYGELSIDYLERIKQRPELASDIAQTWDLEMSKSWRLAVREAFNAAEAEQRLAKAQSYLDKFLKEQPEHPAVADALESWGAILVERGQQQLRIARVQKDAAAKAKYLASAHRSFEEAKTQLTKAVELHHKHFTELRGAVRDRERKTRTSRSRYAGLSGPALEAQLSWLSARFKSAMIDYYLGQTYADPADPARKAALQTAAAAFDQIFQENRESIIGVRANTWHGKCADELGDDQLALDIYDEVLANAPEDRRDRDTDLAPLFAQVELFRLEIVRRKNGERPFMLEAAGWLKDNKSWHTTEGYQGIAFELAKAYLDAMAKEPEQKDNLKRDALSILGDMARIESEYQSDAIILRRK